MTHSDSINELATALANAQGEIEGAMKEKVNPHFKSAYADLAAVWDACRKPLAKNGLAILQPVAAIGPEVTVTTILTHRSGQWIAGELTMTAQQNTPQGLGSCITYARRYALSAMVGVAPEDDDGEAASKTNGQARQSVISLGITEGFSQSVSPDGYDQWWIDIQAVCDEGFEPFKAAWKASKPEYRDQLRHLDGKANEKLKARAQEADAKGRHRMGASA